MMKSYDLEQLLNGINTKTNYVDLANDDYIKNYYKRRKRYVKYTLLAIYENLRQRKKNLNRVEIIEYISKCIHKYRISEHMELYHSERSEKQLLTKLYEDLRLENVKGLKLDLIDFIAIGDYIKDVKPLTVVQRMKLLKKY